MKGPCVVVVAGAGFDGGTTSPALGGGGTGDEDDCVGPVEIGMAPGCGGGGEVPAVDVGKEVVGVGARVFEPAVPVGAGRFGAAPGWAAPETGV